MTFAGPVSNVGGSAATFTTGSNGFAAGNLTFTGGLFNNTTVSNPGLAGATLTGGTGLIRIASPIYMSSTVTFAGGNVRLDTPLALGTAANITGVNGTTTLDFNGNSPTAGKHMLLGSSNSKLINDLAGTTVTLTNGISVTGTTATSTPIYYTSIPTFQVINNASDTTGTGRGCVAQWDGDRSGRIGQRFGIHLSADRYHQQRVRWNGSRCQDQFVEAG